MECKAMFGDPGDVFFSDDVLQRNRYIKRGALVEASPILLLLRCLEASEWQFLSLVDKQWNLGA